MSLVRHPSPQLRITADGRRMQSFLQVSVACHRNPNVSHALTCSLGLIDKNENAEQAAIRELEEETGFKAAGVIQTSPLLVCDPGICILAPYRTRFSTICRDDER